MLGKYSTCANVSILSLPMIIPRGLSELSSTTKVPSMLSLCRQQRTKQTSRHRHHRPENQTLIANIPTTINSNIYSDVTNQTTVHSNGNNDEMQKSSVTATVPSVTAPKGIVNNDSLLIEGAGALSNVEGIPASSSKRKKKKKRKNLTKSKKKDKYNGSDAGEVGKEPSTIKKKKCSINERKR